ncbi:synaptic vesicle glycoprotein 2B-like isoform X4 [Aricia agestis]|uniref:synaptic vesicle glycoprotein 2B-like isoform X4 n=1 Tax=Aricia agestis TaxID=91739 RepID=UPI001C2082E9|nr:synaptic vesicle glycoprotein 2B-like isoform X4 [Aricia agestis]
MVNKSIKTIFESVDDVQSKEVDLDEALSIAGLGWYNLKYCAVLTLFLISIVLEPVGYSYVLPAAKCDLQMSDSHRGFLGSMPYIGVILTSFPWGYLVDIRGRKKMIILSSMAAGILGVASAFMPNLLSFTILKFLTSLFIACPASVPYTFIGEILPAKYRDVILSVSNALQITGSALVPLFAWAILPLDFRLDFGTYYFRSWRMLSVLYSCSFLISALLMLCGPESPKYLLQQGRHEESLQALRKIYAGNKNKPASEYPVKRLTMPESKKEKVSFVKSLKSQSVPLLKPPYLKYMALNGILLIGTFATLNGLYIWLPDVLNRVLTGSGETMTVCQVIRQRLNETHIDEVCVDQIDRMTYIINASANMTCAVVAVLLSSAVRFLGKKVLLIGMFSAIGVFVILINFVTQQVLFAILLSSIQLTAVVLGPINAFAVDIFPTNLRGMAIGLTMMIGRMGSVFGANIAGLLLNSACEITFYGFGGSLLLCALLSCLQPKTKKKDESPADSTKL